MDLMTGAGRFRETTALAVEDPSQVATVRRRGIELASGLGFDETASGRVALALTEAATNLLKHAGRGEILLGVRTVGGQPCVQALVLDQGPGMANVDRCFEDGYSTAGSAGTGLGAVRRLASAVDVYSRRSGTALLLRIGPAAPAGAAPAPAIDGLSVAVGGESVCGDAWDYEVRGGQFSLLVVDGLGHGPGAAEAAQEAVRAFRRHSGTAPAERVERMYEALRGTRGAAVAVAEVDPDRRLVRFSGLGNVAGALLGDERARHLVSHHGIAGHTASRIEHYTYPWPDHGLLVMHSDGLATLRDLGPYPGLTQRDPGLVAGVLYRDFARRRDDVTVVVARGLAA